MDKRTDTIDVVNNLFNLAMDVQNDFLKKNKFPELSMSEMHVIEAVSKVEFPNMTNVSNYLSVTIGTLTTAVKKIVQKGFLIRKQSADDHRVFTLELTEKGKEALEVHNQFHHELSSIYKSRIPEERMDWVFETLKAIYVDLLDYKKTID